MKIQESLSNVRNLGIWHGKVFVVVCKGK